MRYGPKLAVATAAALVAAGGGTAWALSAPPKGAHRLTVATLPAPALPAPTTTVPAPTTTTSLPAPPPANPAPVATVAPPPAPVVTTPPTTAPAPTTTTTAAPQGVQPTTPGTVVTQQACVVKWTITVPASVNAFNASTIYPDVYQGTTSECDALYATLSAAIGQQSPGDPPGVTVVSVTPVVTETFQVTTNG